MNIYIYEDNRALDLAPISSTRAIFDIRIGQSTFFDRIKLLFPQANISLFVRTEVEARTSEKHPEVKVNPKTVDEGIWLLGSVLWEEVDIQEALPSDTLFYKNKDMIGGFLTKSSGNKWLANNDAIFLIENKIQKKSIYCRFLWQILNEIPQMILSESIQNKKQIDSSIYPERILINSERIFTHDDINIQRGALINAENGPVIIDRGAVIYGQTYLEGPLYIGKNTIIKPLTQIKNSIIGPMCRIGGELETVIIQGYTNKVHGGHLGDSFIGKWVNLGAGTQNSNLKNNYSSVKVEVNGQNFDTKSLKIGCFIGDHTKTAIGTLLNSGTVLGVGSMIASSGFPPKTILPFTWYINREIKKVILDKFFESTCNVMRRRNEVLSEVERDLLKELQDKY